ncbi:MAG: sugar phosphate isomerase/epimerase [Actinomycetota bacterium]|nr:sugar phosphate isomerase/epimerase [Actinomycetota bacterium]
MYIGVSTMLYEVSKSLDYLDKFEYIEKSGLKNIELSDVFNFQKNVIDAINRQNLCVFSMHAEYEDADISSPDEEKRRNGIEDAIKRIGYLKKLNGKLLVIHPGGWYSDKKEKNTRIINCINSLVYVLNKTKLKNIKIAIENLPTEFFGDDIETVKHILDKVREITGSKNTTGICLDTGHGLLADNINDYLSNLYDDILSMHIHDNKGDNNGSRSKAEDDLHSVPGNGIIEWQSIIDILSERNYDGGFIFEIKKGQKSLKEVINEIRQFIDDNLFLKQNI